MSMYTLAQDGTSFSFSQLIDDAAAWLDIFNHPDRLIESLAQLPLIIGAVLVVVGGLCIFNGYRWHRWVIIVLAALGGLGIGHMLSQQMGRSHILAVAIGLMCAVIATPLLRFSVAIFGGLAGAFVGANAWTAFNNGADAHWAGAAMGFILLAMAAFILFRLVVMFFTSIGGAAMLVCGAITLLLHVEGWAPGVRDHLQTNQMLLPVLVGIGAVVGFVLQETQFKQQGGGAKAA